MGKLVISEKEKGLILELRALIEQTKNQIGRYINQGMVMLYWQIGQRLKEEVLQNRRAVYGQEVVALIAQDLSAIYGRGFSRVSLIRMIQFYEAFPDHQISSTVSNQLTWSHIIELLSIPDKVQQEFYMFMAAHENWSVRELRSSISRMVYERTLVNQRPKQSNIPMEATFDIDADLILKDPYILDFLDLPDVYQESDLEAAILSDIEKFILELGAGFCDEFPPIGIILCTEKSEHQIELLDLQSSGIHVAQYWTELPPKEVFERKLQESLRKSTARLLVKNEK